MSVPHPLPAISMTLAMFVVGGLRPAVAQAETTPAVYGRIPATTELPEDGCVIPFGIYRGRPAVSVRINGKGPFLLLVDSGAGTTVLNHDLVAELELPVLEQSRLGDPSDPQAIETDIVNLENLRVGEAVFGKVQAASWDRSALYPDRETMPRGILGFPLFAHCLLTVDAAAERFVLKRGRLSATERHTVSYELWHGVCQFPMELAGKPVQAHLDTGFGGGLMLPRGWAETLALAAPPRVIGRGRTVNSDFEILQATLDGAVSIAGHRLDSPEVLFAEIMNAADRVVLGVGFMRRYTITFDQEHRRVQFLPVAARAGEADAFEAVLPGPVRERGVHVAALADGGYVVAGVTQRGGDSGADAMLLRADVRGEVMWTRSYGGDREDNGWAVVELDDGFALAGFTKSLGAAGYDFFLVRTDAAGEVLWQKTYGGDGDDRCWALARSEDGGFLLAGETDSSGAGERDWLVIATDAAGNQMWSKTYGGARDDRCFSIAPGPDGGWVLAGQTYSDTAGDRDAQVLAIDAGGGQRWSHKFGGEASDVGHSICRTAAGDYLVTGYTKSFGANGEDPFLMRLRADGSTVWTRVLPVPGRCRAITGAAGAGGGFFCVGFATPPGARRGEAVLLRVDDEGALEWRRQFFGQEAGESMGYTVAATPDGGCVFTGHVVRAGDTDAFLVKAGADAR